MNSFHCLSARAISSSLPNTRHIGNVGCARRAGHAWNLSRAAASSERQCSSPRRVSGGAADGGGRLVLAQALVNHLAQQIVVGPGEKLEWSSPATSDKIRGGCW